MPKIAIIGATGAVGRVMLEILLSHIPEAEVALVASKRSAGKKLSCAGKTWEIVCLDDFDFSGFDIALFSAGKTVSEQYVPKAREAGTIVIDNTSAFRYMPEIPLVIPEVNPEQIQKGITERLIANPNCSTIQMLVALKPIYDAVGIEHIYVSTYQAVSGAGIEAVNALKTQAQAVLAEQSFISDPFPVQMAFNCVPKIDTFESNGYTREEMKMFWETQKILDDKVIGVTPTAVRVPVINGHSEAITVRVKKQTSLSDLEAYLEASPSITLLKGQSFATAALDADGRDAVFISRLRQDLSDSRTFSLWVVSDNLRKGAALNSVQIAQKVLEIL